MKKTTENRQTVLARRQDLVVQELPDEVLLYDLKRHKAHCLNSTAAFVWNHCDGHTTVAEMAKLMAAKWNASVSEDMIWLTLDKLSKANLLEERIVLPPSKGNLSRRDAVRQMGFGALLAVPAVLSLVSPAAAHATSTAGACQSCVKKRDGAGACPGACEHMEGRCYDNSGCGNGQFIGHCSCSSCLSGGHTRSWEAS